MALESYVPTRTLFAVGVASASWVHADPASIETTHPTNTVVLTVFMLRSFPLTPTLRIMPGCKSSRASGLLGLSMDSRVVWNARHSRFQFGDRLGFQL